MAGRQRQVGRLAKSTAKESLESKEASVSVAASEIWTGQQWSEDIGPE